MNNKHFIATSDPSTYETLKKLGFQELSYDGTRWFFLNEQNKMTFDDEVKNYHYTDILNV